MPDQMVNDMIELKELRAEKKDWEAEKIRFRLVRAIVQRAEEEFFIQYGQRVRIFHPQIDDNYALLPMETRARSEATVRRVIDKLEKDAEAKRREDERQRRHEEFLRKKAESEESERQRITQNFTRIIDGDMLPQTWEGFCGLPSELKTKLLGELGGTALLTEYKAKEASGLSWKSWKALIAYDKDAKLVTASDKDGAPPDNEKRKAE